jgi:hypothetical protein
MPDVIEQLRTYGEAVERSVLERVPEAPARRGWRRPLMLTAAAAGIAIVLLSLALAWPADEKAIPKVAVGDSPTGPTPLSDSPAAEELCNTKGREVAGRDAALRAAFESSRAEVKAWQETRIPDGGTMSGFVAAQPPVSRMVVCWFDGEFPVPLAPGTPVPDRGVVLATDTGAELDFAGSRERLEIARPARPHPSPFVGGVYESRAGVGDPALAVFDNGAALPPGTEDWGGHVVGPTIHHPAPGYGIHFWRTTPSRLLGHFNRQIEGDNPIRWRVLDAVDFELFPPEGLGNNCTLDGSLVVDGSVLAVVSYDDVSSAQWQPARLAWLLDRTTERIVPLDPARVACEILPRGSYD